MKHKHVLDYIKYYEKKFRKNGDLFALIVISAHTANQVRDTKVLGLLIDDEIILKSELNISH